MISVPKPKYDGEYRVGVIAGDLNGITVTSAVLELYPYLERHLSMPIRHIHYPYNADYFNERDINELGDEELEVLAQNDQLYLGAVGDPTKIKPGVLEVGILLKLRQAFDQYVNLRPVILQEGIPSIIVGKTSKDINFEICRENSEGLYVAQGEVLNRGTDDEVGIQKMVCSYRGVKRLAEFAADRALDRKERRTNRTPRLHFAFKTNILTFAAVPWERVYKEFSSRTDLDVRYIHVDNLMMQMVLAPEQFDVILTENMFGDIATDLGAVIQGGIGSAVSGNINPSGRFPSMFEPIHGSAPDKWYNSIDGKLIAGTKREDLIQRVRPEAAFMSYAMMLEQMGEKKAADLLKEAALANLRDPDYKQKNLDELINQTIKYISTSAV
ncbi:MAG: isocitrate/isopropylmalate family dehydrogenase [Nanoarchaeota archaeon]|nr:isocitrate/isopropylmalate family dehydrogenase [Nanoarchaeota archaeon]